MEREPAQVGSRGTTDLNVRMNMRSFLAWYQVLLAGALAIIFAIPIFLASVRFDCGGTGYAVTCMVWIFGLISITGSTVTPRQLDSSTVIIGVITWFFYGLVVVLLINSIRIFHKKLNPTLVKVRNEVFGSFIGLLLVGVIMNALDLFVASYSPAGLAILVPATLLKIFSKRLYPTKETLDKFTRRIAEIQQDLTKEIIAGHQDALLNEIQDMMAVIRGGDFIGMAIALSQCIQFMAGILQSLRERKAMSIESLKAAYKVKDFPAMILELCQQFNLTIQGDTIQLDPASSIDPQHLLNEIDKMFTTWKGNEAAKLAKI